MEGYRAPSALSESTWEGLAAPRSSLRHNAGEAPAVRVCNERLRNEPARLGRLGMFRYNSSLTGA